jgi:phage terminase large subunit-like protein
LNIWIEGAAAPWIDLALYDAAEPATGPESLAGRRCYVGVDLSSVEDLTAVVAVFPDGDGETRCYDVLATFFLPQVGLAKKAERDRADYLRWRDAGVLKVTEGNVVDHAAVIAEVVELGKRYAVQEVAIDRWNSTAVNTALQAEGFTVAQFGQGYASMAAPVKELKRATMARHFRHGGNPALRSCFGNVVATKDDAENEQFTKERSRGRIDGAVAAAMGVGRVLASETGPLIYERRPEFLFV